MRAPGTESYLDPFGETAISSGRQSARHDIGKGVERLVEIKKNWRASAASASNAVRCIFIILLIIIIFLLILLYYFSYFTICETLGAFLWTFSSSSRRGKWFCTQNENTSLSRLQFERNRKICLSEPNRDRQTRFARVVCGACRLRKLRKAVLSH